MRICTHDGVFHGDDAMACAILRLSHPGIEILRSRRPEDWLTADFVSDVGGRNEIEYSPNSILRYWMDHHQKGGAGERENGVPYAAAGLGWKEWGLEAICSVAGPLSEDTELAIGEEIDRNIIQGIDASDVGYDPVGEEKKWIESMLPSQDWQKLSELEQHDLFGKLQGFQFVNTHAVPRMTISHIVSGMNPRWCDDQSKEAYDWYFLRAVEFMEDVLRRAILESQGKHAAISMVRQARNPLHPRQVLVLEQFCPWQETVIREFPDVLYVIFPAPGGKQWNVQCVPDAVNSFGKRKALPEGWAGMPPSYLQDWTGVSDAVFCHNGRFICGAASREGAIRLAELAVQA